MLAALILGAIIWAGKALTNNIEVNARTDERLKNIESVIVQLRVELESRMTDRYTGRDADQRARVVDRQIKDLTNTVEKQGARLSELEKYTYSNGSKGKATFSSETF